MSHWTHADYEPVPDAPPFSPESDAWLRLEEALLTRRMSIISVEGLLQSQDCRNECYANEEWFHAVKVGDVKLAYDNAPSQQDAFTAYAVRADWCDGDDNGGLGVEWYDDDENNGCPTFAELRELTYDM
jgi:hypothetical protein